VQKVVFGRAGAKALGFGFCHTERRHRIVDAAGQELPGGHLGDGLGSIVPVHVGTIGRIVLYHPMED
jgi:hypothetical protein